MCMDPVHADWGWSKPFAFGWPLVQPHQLLLSSMTNALQGCAQVCCWCSLPGAAAQAAIVIRAVNFKFLARIKDAGIAIRHSRGRILFYTAGSRNRFEGMDPVCRHTKKQTTISKIHVPYGKIY